MGLRQIYYSASMKRIFDLSLVIMASPIWVPVLLLVALWVRFRLGSPVFFTQERPGLHAKSFELIKFPDHDRSA